jgi:hypothetical protein
MMFVIFAVLGAYLLTVSLIIGLVVGSSFASSGHRFIISNISPAFKHVFELHESGYAALLAEANFTGGPCATSPDSADGWLGQGDQRVQRQSQILPPPSPNSATRAAQVTGSGPDLNWIPCRLASHSSTQRGRPRRAEAHAAGRRVHLHDMFGLRHEQSLDRKGSR